MLLVAVAGCAQAGTEAPAADARLGGASDAAFLDGALGTADARVIDSSAVVDATLAVADADLTDLSPDLETADPSGQVCTTPGSLGECPGIAVCQFYSSTEGRCETCETCGNLGASCSASDQCDILFACYLGKCTNFCTLGTSECGPPTNCIDIGHPTKGACLP